MPDDSANTKVRMARTLLLDTFDNPMTVGVTGKVARTWSSVCAHNSTTHVQLA